MTDSEKIKALEETVVDMRLDSIAHQMLIQGLMGCLRALHGDEIMDALLNGLINKEGPDLATFDDPEEADRRIQLLNAKLREFK